MIAQLHAADAGIPLLFVQTGAQGCDDIPPGACGDSAVLVNCPERARRDALLPLGGHDQGNKSKSFNHKPKWLKYEIST